MEELIDIKLKKETYEQELEKTRLEIKKMDEYFDNIRKRKIDPMEEYEKAPKRVNSTDENNQKSDSDIKIIDFKTAKEDLSQKMSENRPNECSLENTQFSEKLTTFRQEKSLNLATENENIDDIQAVPATNQQHAKKQNENVRRLSEHAMPSLSNASENFRQAERHVQRKVAPQEEKILPSLQQLNYQEQKSSFEQVQRRTPTNDNPRHLTPHAEPTRTSPLGEQFPRGREIQLQEERKQFYAQQVQQSKTQRPQESYYPYPPPPPVQQYRDAILIPVNSKTGARNEQLLQTKEQLMRELQDTNFEKAQYQQAMQQLPSPPPYPSVNTFITQHEAMINQRFQENMHIPLRPVPQRSTPMSRLQYLHQNQNLLPYHEQQAAHLRHLSMQKRREIERYIPNIVQELKRPNSGNQPRKSTLPDEKCEACGKDANFMCSACKGAHYCSTVCQVFID